jgi:AAA family ATP:ADP antiporter
MGWLMRVSQFFKSILTVDPKSRYKLFFVALGFMLVIGGYTVIRTLKDSLFLSIVGLEYIPLAKIWSIIMLVPCVLLFSKLVDMVKRYQLIYIYSCIFGIGGLIIAMLLQHPTIGLPNTEAHASRLFGWFIYLFIDLYNPFLVSVFWSFMHSITSPEESKASYPILVACSKLGGMITASLGVWVLSQKIWVAQGFVGEIIAHQVLLSIASGLVLLAPFCIYGLMRFVPASQLHGYEAAYQADKQEKKELAKEPTSLLKSLYSMFSGFIFLFKYPYALGMFGIVFFWEVINAFASFERLGGTHDSLCMRTSMLLQQDFMIHMGGFLVALVGARAIVELLGERRSLILVPVATGTLLAYYHAAKSAQAIGIVYILLRVMNYAFAVPLRERLYTATVKAIKFKSKLWIDSFGVKLAKGAGSGYNMLLMGLSQTAQVNFAVGFFSVLIGVWTVVSNAMGRTFERAVSRGEVIGVEEK